MLDQPYYTTPGAGCNYIDLYYNFTNANPSYVNGNLQAFSPLIDSNTNVATAYGYTAATQVITAKELFLKVEWKLTRIIPFHWGWVMVTGNGCRHLCCLLAAASLEQIPWVRQECAKEWRSWRCWRPKLLDFFGLADDTRIGCSQDTFPEWFLVLPSLPAGPQLLTAAALNGPASSFLSSLFPFELLSRNDTKFFLKLKLLCGL